MYEGPMGYGKSQLMAEVAHLGQAAGQKSVLLTFVAHFQIFSVSLFAHYICLHFFATVILALFSCSPDDGSTSVNKFKVGF